MQRMEQSVIGKIYKDKEIVWFYWIVAGIPFIISVLAIVQYEWLICCIAFLGILCFLLFGWPISAETTQSGNIIFKGPVRRAKVTSEAIVTVKAGGAHDYRAHIIIRTK